jgi:membrane protease YdiL (CAAX protease family)
MDAPTTTHSQDSGAIYEQHSVARTLVLHLLPGVLVLVFFVAVAPLVRGIGFPPAMAVYLASVFVIVPFELGYLIYQARKNGTSLGNIVLYRQPVPKGQLVLIVVLLFVGGIILGGLLTPVDFFVKENLFSWVPSGYDVTYGLYRDVARFSTTALLVMWVFGLPVNVIAGPVVEEMYFRGYLLPRISRFGAWAPLLNTVLFSLYHFFNPFGFISRIGSFLPVVYGAWWKRSIYVSMIVHVLFNFTASVFTLLLILGIFGGVPG